MNNGFDKPAAPAIPKIYQLIAWLASFLVFLLGFWHTHMGLKEMKPLGSEWGGLAFASIVLLVLLFTYYLAIKGKKIALVFYIICGLVFFVCNLNYFYPAKMARTLVKEEAMAINDSLQTFSNKSKFVFADAGFRSQEGDGSLSDYNYMLEKCDLLYQEIRDFNGVGPRARSIMRELDVMLHEKNDLNTNYQGTERADYYKKAYLSSIERWLNRHIEDGSDISNAGQLMIAVGDFDTLQRKYTPILVEEIIPDNSEVNINQDSIRANKQITTLQLIVTKMDDASNKINTATKKPIFNLIGTVKTQKLGRIEHTLQSVYDRIGEIDTLFIVFFCLFLDLIVPLAIYVLLKNQPVQHRVDPFKLGRGPVLLDR